ncbi:ornithine cyclodeaminase [Arthrobacter stackebrandtii]|uniref:Ornithine cyclodeaminase n=1 Tax=Arthrobacter stackebrandtii TaxID=272161 RepID=A0ABS4YVJ1_9MICC|nr:ornithine cyclodeaminase family protein [Arthrobacter stackebrandtii]MBP2412825.1 ornithine cyclodeaminase [Arthrobacter stackebrandtii]PYH01354.1 ornithine cyclodeaminase [Arthrobacter stackebrandtii]
MTLPYFDAAQLQELLPPGTAVAALEEALRGGLDPELDSPRLFAPLDAGEFLLMPAQSARYAGIKVVTVAPENPAKGHPKIQGTYLLLDKDTLAPLAAMDGAELTLIRTPAVTTMAVKGLLALRGAESAGTVAVLGTSLQADRHIEALAAVCGIGELVVIGRRPEAAQALADKWAAQGIPSRAGSHGDLAAADVILCATSSAEPVFDGALPKDSAVIAAIGSHGLDAREIDPVLARRAEVVVEGRASALREAGDLIPARSAQEWQERGLATLSDLANGRFDPDPGKPLLYTGVGMSWEDIVVAGRAFESAGSAGGVH